MPSVASDAGVAVWPEAASTAACKAARTYRDSGARAFKMDPFTFVSTAPPIPVRAASEFRFGRKRPLYCVRQGDYAHELDQKSL